MVELTELCKKHMLICFAEVLEGVPNQNEVLPALLRAVKLIRSSADAGMIAATINQATWRYKELSSVPMSFEVAKQKIGEAAGKALLSGVAIL